MFSEKNARVTIKYFTTRTITTYTYTFILIARFMQDFRINYVDIYTMYSY